MKDFKIQTTLAIPIIKILVLQSISSFLYLLITIFSDFIIGLGVKQGLFLNIFGYDTLSVLLVALTQLALTAYIFLEWGFDLYIIHPNKINHVHGILFRKTDSYDTTNIETAHIEESIFGRIFNYGTITMHSPSLEENIILYNIAMPSLVLNNIKENQTKNKSNIIFTKKNHREY